MFGANNKDELETNVIDGDESLAGHWRGVGGRSQERDEK